MRTFDSWEDWESWAADLLDAVNTIRDRSDILKEDFKEQTIAIDFALEAIEETIETAEPLKEEKMEDENDI